MPTVSKQIHYIGVDPGKSGGIVVVTGRKAFCHPMPQTEHDIWKVFDEYNSREGVSRPSFAAIEQISPGFPGTGKSQMAKLYGSYMSLRMCLVAAGIPFQEVTSQRWQKEMGIPKRKSNEAKPKFKDRLRQFAQQLFPRLRVWQDTLTKQRAVCDALILAEYCRRKHTGVLQ